MKIIRTGGEAGFKDMPIQVSWFLTGKCNYRCSYCFHYGEGKTPPRQFPFSTLDQCKTAIKNIASLNRPWYELGFIGGEPIIHPHITDIISMFHESLGERLDFIVVSTNGSRNDLFYKKIASIAKSVNLRMNISIHTDHVDMDHILKLIETLSRDVRMNFPLMFNPAKRKMVHEIYETMLKYRAKFPFNLSVVLIRQNDRLDPRYTEEDIAWQRGTADEFRKLTRSVASKVSLSREPKHLLKIFHDVEDNGERKIVETKNRNVNLTNGLLQFKGMYCISYSSLIYINETGQCRGINCGAEPYRCNVYEENAFTALRDNLIKTVKCPLRICGCPANDKIPKFSSIEEATEFSRIVGEKQNTLFDEYYASHPIKTI